MTETFLVKLFEHNNWANQKIIEACYALSDEQLDTEPHSVTKGNIRETLSHLVTSQRGYLALPAGRRYHGEHRHGQRARHRGNLRDAQGRRARRPPGSVP